MNIFSTWNLAEFEALVREHQAGLRAFIRAMGADAAWVDDIAQDAFLVAYRRKNSFREGADFGKWLRGIARNLVMAERRKNANSSRIVHSELTDVLLQYAPVEDSRDDDRDGVLVAMQECVGLLPDAHQDLLKRRYTTGERAVEMAHALLLTAEAVRKRLQRIRQTVKGCIERKMGVVRL